MYNIEYTSNWLLWGLSRGKSAEILVFFAFFFKKNLKHMIFVNKVQKKQLM
jgi:hypothetical protein